jgi:hypothetical protein
MVERLRSWWWKVSIHPVATVLIAIVATFIVVIVLSIVGYIFHWNWTGFGQKTLWDWMQLLIVPVVLAVGAFLFNIAASRNEQKIALDSQRETLLQDYFDRMSELLLDKQLPESDSKAIVRYIARSRTLTVLPRLDADRKRSLLQFLHESDLISVTASTRIISLKGANLSKANLRKINLSMANLSGTDLSGADLREADLSGTLLSRANLSKANLSGANLNKANLRMADLSGADLSGADLSEVYFQDAIIRKEQLDRARQR